LVALREVDPLTTASSSSFVTKRRRSTLLPWVQPKGEAPVTLGWTVEERRQGTSYRVTVGWGQDAAGGVTTVELPCTAVEDSLASSLWNSALAGAVLCASPAFAEAAGGRRVLELGSGLGLAGWTAAQAAKPASCVLSDSDEAVMRLQQRLIERRRNGNVEALVLEWRDDHADAEPVDVILATDVAYYWYLLRPLMDTVKAYLKPSQSMCVIFGQANRESQWDLYHNIINGCYNQLTDEREGAWPGTTRMLLYKLQMCEWTTTTTGDDEDDAHVVDGTVPIAALIHCTPGSEELGPFSQWDYVATDKDREGMLMTF
jgi:predicted nicotinamide N-methyase